MKICFFVLCCLVSTLHYKSVMGGLVKDFFEKVHDTAHTVREDLEKSLHLNGHDTNSTETEKEKDQVPTETNVEKNKESSTNIPTTSTTTTAPKVETTPSTTQSVTVSTTASTVTTTVATGPNANTTEGEGRENFKATCQTGYQRTADGRCKPTF